MASLLIINNLVRSIYTLWQKRDLVENARQEVEEKKRENEVLKKKIKTVERPQFIEEEARNKLFLSKPGEGVIVLSQKDLEATLSAEPKPRDSRPNWKKWLDLFF